MGTKYTAVLILLAVYDSKLGAYLGAPLGCPTRGVGERDFEAAVNDPKTPFYQYPDDFELHEIGTMDMATGEIECAKPRPVVYGRASQWKRKEVPVA